VALNRERERMRKEGGMESGDSGGWLSSVTPPSLALGLPLGISGITGQWGRPGQDDPRSLVAGRGRAGSDGR
jgi:hypothetical protein